MTSQADGRGFSSTEVTIFFLSLFHFPCLFFLDLILEEDVIEIYKKKMCDHIHMNFSIKKGVEICERARAQDIFARRHLTLLLERVFVNGRSHTRSPADIYAVSLLMDFSGGNVRRLGSVD